MAEAATPQGNFVHLYNMESNATQFTHQSRILKSAQERRNRGLAGMICLILVIIFLLMLIAPAGLILVVIGSICIANGNLQLCENSYASAATMIVFGCIFLACCSCSLGAIVQYKRK
jgi:hypothetical protein